MIPFDLALGAVLAFTAHDRVEHVARAEVRTCADPLAVLLADEGWTGRQNKVAWAVVMRESNGQPGTWSGGAAGLFQLQASVWSDAKWWNWDRVFEPRANARMARIVWEASGWQPWGLTDDGRAVNARDYAGWSDAEQHLYIWAPYSYWRERYPC